MPQIAVSYSAELEPHLDRSGFAHRLHEEAAELLGSPLTDFKTRFLPIGYFIVGDGQERARVLHAEISLLDGRTEELRERLGDLALAALSANLTAEERPPVHITVEVRQMHRASYRKEIRG